MKRATRREFIATTGLITATAGRAVTRGAEEHKHRAEEVPLVISTWPFGKPANDRALEILKSGGSALDAVERGINVTENDPAVPSVGLQGAPNAAGIAQLDACIMDGPTHKAGSVAALEQYPNPISVARRVMEKTPHVLVVGAGAAEFAAKEGFKKAYERTRAGGVAAPYGADNHDTIALVALARDGTIAGGCSTSGLARKLPGRVGDSPIIGSGLYVDNDIGGAGATGVGENVMRFCASFQIVELMAQGMHPTEACVQVIKRIMKKHPPGTDLNINFVALNKKGEYGGAGTGKGFQYAVTTPDFSKVLQSAAVPIA